MKKVLCLFIFLSNLVIADSTIYLSRHAEKITTNDTKNPELTAIGNFRALNIAKQLSEVGITEIYSTDYNRTLQTAQPLAKHLGLEIKIYDPRKLSEFAEKIKPSKGQIFIVGHSNTTPQLTALISGQSVKPIDESEYDNLYQIILLNNNTLLNKFKSIPSYELNPSNKKLPSANKIILSTLKAPEKAQIHEN